MTPKRLAALGLATGLITGGAAGLALGVPGLAGAQTEAPAPDRAAKAGWAGDALDPLVENGTLTRAQADAVIAALEANRPERRGGHFGFKRGLDAAAGALGMTAGELRSAVRDGQSLADVAKGKGVSPDTVVDAIVADARARIAEKVTDGRLTQEQADRLTAELTERTRAFVNGETPAGAPGHRRGHRGHGPRGQGPLPS